MQSGLHGAGWPSEVFGDVSLAEVEPISKNHSGAFAHRQLSNKPPGLIDLRIDRRVSDRRRVTVGDLASPEHRHRPIYHRTLEITDRIIDLGYMCVQASERFLNYFLGQPTIERDRCCELHKPSRVLAEHHISSVHRSTFRLLEVDGCRAQHRLASNQPGSLLFSHHTDLTPNPSNRFSQSQDAK